ncbi:MAG: SDR family oxidoreductase [Gammaproteobacteria bacterium]|nr:SDR family oxidoreductase [Gammaproteobacteria bacterium]
MKLKNCRVLITGASGGIGQHIATELAQQGARLGLVGLRQDALLGQQTTLKKAGYTDVHTVSADLTTANGRQRAIEEIRSALGGIDLLINNAGVVDFHEFSNQDPAMIDRIYQINLIAPIQMTRQVLPGMLEQGSGKIVNIGSTFGSIGFAYFTAYSGSKFGLRGFSESLRREIDGSGVDLCYIAPRAVKTPANCDAVYHMAEATNMNMDEPEAVAHFIVKSIIKDKSTAYYGWPEKLFVRINALLPGLVDSALRKQNRVIARFAPKKA